MHIIIPVWAHAPAIMKVCSRWRCISGWDHDDVTCRAAPRHSSSRSYDQRRMWKSCSCVHAGELWDVADRPSPFLIIVHVCGVPYRSRNPPLLYPLRHISLLGSISTRCNSSDQRTGQKLMIIARFALHRTIADSHLIVVDRLHGSASRIEASSHQLHSPQLHTIAARAGRSGAEGWPRCRW